MSDLGYGPHIVKKGIFYQCELCQAFLNGLGQVRSHISGSSHAKKVANQLSNTTALSGNKSANQSFAASETNDLSSLDPESSRFIVQSGLFYKCICCKTDLNSKDQVRQHTQGAKHLKCMRTFDLNRCTINKQDAKTNNNIYSTPLNGPGHSGLKVSVDANKTALSGDAWVKQLSAVFPDGSESIKDHSLHHIIPCGLLHKCTCCDKVLNSEHQIKEHIHGAEHLKALTGFCANQNNSNTAPESFDFLSSLRNISSEEVLKDVKLFEPDEPIVF